MKSIRNISYRRLSSYEVREVRKLLTEKKSMYPILLLPLIGLFSVSAVLSYFGGDPDGGGSLAFAQAVVAVVLVLVLIYDAAVKVYKVRAVERGRVAAADVICINIHSATVDYEHIVKYYFQTLHGESFLLRGRSILKDKPVIGKRCRIINFGGRYFSVLR